MATQDLWQDHYQTLLIIMPKELITSCKHGHDNMKRMELNTKILSAAYINVKHDLIEHKCMGCDKNYHKRFDENSKKKFTKTLHIFLP